MADQKRWFKVWNSILTDPSFLDLPVSVIGHWTLLGSLLSLHGENGQITLTDLSLRNILRIDNETTTEMALSCIPNVQMKRLESDNGKISVIMKNWSKYQLDSTGYERLKKFRKAHNDNGAREEKRREEKDKKREYKEYAEIEVKKCIEENKEIFLKAYPAINIESESQKALSWLISNPQNKKKAIKRFLNNWFSRAQEKAPRVLPSFKIEQKPSCPKCGKENAKAMIWEDGCSLCLRADPKQGKFVNNFIK